MTTIHAQLIGDKALLTRKELEELVAMARLSGEIDLQFQEEDASILDMMRLAEAGGSFDFWHDKGEDIYSEEDGEPV